jgi:class 3 adenylate cyclase
MVAVMQMSAPDQVPCKSDDSESRRSRQQVTALFYDIVNSTTLLGAIDPEDFGTAQHVIHIAAAEAISRHGGSLEQIVGDGGCAYFGYPVASEDAAESAINAALDVIESCGRSARTAGLAVPLQVRVGVATGNVVVRNGAQAGLPGGSTIVGLAPNLAARLQAMAAPNSAIVADSTYVLTSATFDFQLVGTSELKGFDSPQRLWRPLSKRRVDLRYETRRESKGALLAREDELGECRRLWAKALEGYGAAVFITGEAGIGKSRLVSEVLGEAKGRGG